ncbi:MAG: prephenate dehydrogenase/arogenate dehydrogenase family protein [Alphaproteobacteria bacterium]|nr:prephenate dehydrogenase/arogenate dehydrogenase family protein [Alphaproteobacteria bacterium]
MKIAVIGSGQVGCVFIRDLGRNASDVEHICYYDINETHLKQMEAIAAKHKLAHAEGFTDEEQFINHLRDADVIIAAVPGDQVGSVTKKYARYFKRGAVYSETASAQVPACEEVKKSLKECGRDDIHFIYIHPGTGSATPGPGATNPDAYKNAAVFIDRLSADASTEQKEAWRKVAGLLKSLGAQIEPALAEENDYMFAVSSGYHHLTAYTYLEMLRYDDGSPRPEGQYASTIASNMTRICGSGSDMLVPLFRGHKERIPEINQAVTDYMKSIGDAIARKDAKGLEAILVKAQTYRLALAPKDSVPRESIEADIMDFCEIKSLLNPDSFARGVLLPCIFGYAETLNAIDAFKTIAFDRFPNPSFLDGSAPCLNDPKRMAVLFIENADQLIPVLKEYIRRLDADAAMIQTDDETQMRPWIEDTRECRALMPPPRRARETQYNGDGTVKDNAARFEYLLNMDRGEPKSVVASAVGAGKAAGPSC